MSIRKSHEKTEIKAEESNSPNVSRKTHRMPILVRMIFFGIISDKLSAKIAIITYACICIVALIPLILHGNPLFILIAAFSYNFTASNSSVGISIITSDLFGESNYSKVYPMLSFIGSYALAFASAMIGFMYDLFGSYSPVLIAIMVLQICIVFITFNAYRLKKA